MKVSKDGRLFHATVQERLLAYVLKDEGTGCWNWTRRLDRCGYGKILIGRNVVLAHRASYTTFIGPIPSNVCVLHACDNPACINPKHLRLGTQRDNLLDMYSKGRQNLAGLQCGQRPDVLQKIAANNKRINGRFAAKDATK